MLGGWLAWAHPDLNRWIDGLADAYPVSQLRDTAKLNEQSPGWYALVRGSRARVAILDADSSLAAALEERGWTSVATDAGFVLLRSPRHHLHVG